MMVRLDFVALGPIMMPDHLIPALQGLIVAVMFVAVEVVVVIG